MPADKFIFKVYCDGRVERICDCDNVTFSDVSRWLGVSSREIECKPLRDSGIYAFYGDEKSNVLVFAIPEHKPRLSKPTRKRGMIHGILASQFKMLSGYPVMSTS
ncbi:MAG: hypothetical protein BWK79_11370 [Beggiatoa sp. IS2]|nr:MAG: hypothetical protein BWK79_11370 [Beggiatoa sp. IS2]